MSTTMRPADLVVLLLLAACACAGATCLRPKRSVGGEFRSTAIVATGMVTSAHDVSAPDDPKGVDHTIYRVELTRVFKGGPRRHLELFSENTTSRFPMDRGVPFLLFITRGKEGWFVDNCGWSGRLGDRTTIATLGRVEALVRRDGARQD